MIDPSPDFRFSFVDRACALELEMHWRNVEWNPRLPETSRHSRESRVCLQLAKHC